VLDDGQCLSSQQRLLPLTLSECCAALRAMAMQHGAEDSRLARGRLDEHMMPNCIHGHVRTNIMPLWLCFVEARLKLRRHSARLMCHRRTVQSTDADSRKWAGVQLRSTTSCGAEPAVVSNL